MKLLRSIGVLFFVMAALFTEACGLQENSEQSDRIRTGKKQDDISYSDQIPEASKQEALGRGDAAKDDRTPLVLAVFGDSSQLSRQVTQYNQSNTAYRVEIKQYQRFDLGEEDGLARLQREIMTGKGPDIIDFGAGYATSDIVGGYTENLLPYLKADDGQIEEKYFNNILEAFYYKDVLYALPTGFTLQTFAGASKELGNRKQWNIREMISCYEEKAENMLLYPGQTKADVFGTLLTGSMDYFIDWENGACSFDGEEFCDILSFANNFPNKLEITEDFSVKQTFFEGGALLLPLRLSNIFDICRAEFIFGEEEISYVGFPIEGECGTVVNAAGPMLAISVNSRYKDAAWEFISLFLEEPYQKEQPNGFPLCRSVLEERLLEACRVEYEADSEGRQSPVARDKVIFEGEEPIYIYSVSEKQAYSLTALIEGATICVANDRQLYNLLLEEAGSYFSGSKSLDDTVKVMQSRASIYIKERVKSE